MTSRRQFISLLGGAAAAWPVAAWGQQATIPVVGYLFAGSPEPTTHLLASFRRGLREVGYVEGQNVTIEYRWAHNDNNRLPELAADLVSRRVNVIAVPASTPAGLAAKAATMTIPIVFAIGVDPVRVGLVNSLSRPGGNVTGVSYMQTETGVKRVGLLRELLPKAARFAVLANPTNSNTDSLTKDVRDAAVAIGWQTEVFNTSTARHIDEAFAKLRQSPVDALVVIPDPLFFSRRVQIVTLATRQGIPTIYANREYAEIGGLMSYGPVLTNEIRQIGVYTGRILKGEKPADLPVMLPIKFELVINLQTARSFGIEVSPSLLAIADEVIE